jgi:lysozyme
MKLSERGAALIADFEGVVLHAYNDPVGHCTCGVGHLIHMGNCTAADFQRFGTKQHPKMTRRQATDLLRRDAASREEAVRRLVRVPLSQNEFDALVSLVFNIGEGNFASSTVLRALNTGQRRKAARAFMLWIKAGSPLQVLPGLVRRRRAEMTMFLKGIKNPIRYTDEERHLLKLIQAEGINERRRLRVRDLLKARAALLQRRARGGPGPDDNQWETADRGRRFRGIRRALRALART